MPSVAFVALSGFRVREREMLALGMQLPGLAQRAPAVGALPALGVLTLAALTPADWSVSYHEAPTVTDSLVSMLLKERPTLVAISALTASISEAYRLSDLLRGEGVRVVIGGLHVTACPDEATLHADAVVVGDGEPVWPDVLADAQAGQLRPLYRSTGPFDLKCAPLPRLDLLGPKARPRYTLQTSRGCPFACEFCGAQRLLGPLREKPAELVARELAQITTLHPRATVELADDNTFARGDMRTIHPLLDALERSGVRYFTECDWRIGENSELVARLAGSGCVQVLIGIESRTHEYPGMGAKRSSERRVLDAIEHIQSHGVSVIGCFVVGADTDNWDSIHALGEWLLGAPFADIQLTVQTPFPGTALRRRLDVEGRLLSDRSWESCTLFDVAFRPARMSVTELEAAFRNVVRMVFAPGPTARRNAIRQEIWSRRYSGTP